MASCFSSPISEFYRDRTIFITGATGFMGKVLVEKLLRSCPDVGKLYLLMRPKKGQEVSRRLTEMLAAPLFENLKRNQPEVLKKLVPVEGDVTQPGLGINESNRQLLMTEVSVVFHSAATVRFDEPLKVAVDMNVVGTQRVLELCHEMQKLVSLVHVSTAYCNCDREEVTETVYPLPMKPDKLIDIVQWMNCDVAKVLTPHLIGKRPNAYTYTKAMAEYLLIENRGSLPVAIVRPSIVTAAWKEPIPGWVDNLNGPVGVFIACGKGLRRSLACQGDFVADIIPVDLAINLMISVGWYTATQRPNEALVYNCTSGDSNPITWNGMTRLSYQTGTQNPLNNIFWIPTLRNQTNRFALLFDGFRQHYLPAYLVDILTWITGRKPRLVSIQDKIERALNALEYFTTRQWTFTNDNVKLIWEELDPKDRELFPFDVTQVSWPQYWQKSWLGGKVFVLKEELSDLPAARSHLAKMLVVAHVYEMLKLLAFWRIASSSPLRRFSTWLLSQATINIRRITPH